MSTIFVDNIKTVSGTDTFKDGQFGGTVNSSATLSSELTFAGTTTGTHSGTTTGTISSSATGNWGWKLLQTETVSSAVSNKDIGSSSLFSSTYDTYKIVFTDLVSFAS